MFIKVICADPTPGKDFEGRANKLLVTSHIVFFFLAMGRDWVACEIFRHLTAGRASEAGLPVDEDYSLCL